MIIAINAIRQRPASSGADAVMLGGLLLPSWSANSGQDAANRAAMTRQRTARSIGGIGLKLQY
jgi:hypothetical protein